jgi:hypothetical protein
MIYTSYKIAAERHYEVCLQLVGVLDDYRNKESKGLLNNKGLNEKFQILSDLYYLAGYIIECSYNCAIYKQLGWTANVSTLAHNNNPYNVSCRQSSQAAFVIRRQTLGVKQHQLHGNMHFFQSVIPMANVSTIPLIGYDVPLRLSYDLFTNWNAEIRYEIDSTLNLDYANVYDFFFLATEVYEGLLSNSLI